MRNVLDTSPAVDRRNAERIAERVKQALGDRIPDLEPSQISDALIAVFARYCEILIERINRAPHKALLAFVKLLGVSPHPPQPARVPLTFSVTPKCPDLVPIPKRTQVAGPAASENGQPVVFETEEDLWVSAVQLAAIMTRDPQRDRYGDLSHVAGTVAPSGALLFEASQPTEHSLYLGHSKLLSQPCQELHLLVEIQEGQRTPSSGLRLQWEVWDRREQKDDWIPVTPDSDETDGLTRSGRIVFRPMPGSLPRAVLKMTNAWLRGRLLTPLIKENAADSDRQHQSQTLRIRRLTLQIHHRLEQVEVTHAFVNQVPLDTSKEFYLFGENPKFGDVLYLGHTQALDAPGGRVTLHIELLNPQGGAPGSIRETHTSDDLKIQWEISGVTGWMVLGLSQAGLIRVDATTGFRDETQALAQSGKISFVIPLAVGSQLVNGVKAVWVRARILAGDYGKEAIYAPRDPNAPDKGYVLRPATLAPPLAKHLRISMEAAGAEERPESVITCNDFSYQDVTSSLEEGGAGITPFRPMEGEAPVLHLGFSSTDKAIQLSGYPLHICFHVQDELPDGDHQTLTGPHLDLLWEYWNGTNWSRLSVVDRTNSLSQPGVVRLDVPRSWPASSDFDKLLNWIRIRVNREGLPSKVHCRGIVPHTVMAIHATTLMEEPLGNTTGTPNQSFRTLRTPVLPGQILEVREPFVPGVPYQRRDGAKMWVDWKAVDHFLHSRPPDHHYTIDRQTGEIAFGDGRRGLVPPPDVNNVVMREYRIGGGRMGNVPAESLMQLRTTIPYVQKVVNLVPACGGADSEPLEAFVIRALRLVRHRNRAVAHEDYEDLALAASPLVARAHCVPSYDLARDPTGQRKQSGVLSLMVLPRISSEAPKPDGALLRLVREHLITLTPPGIDIRVMPPRYVPVNVEVDLVLQPGVVPAVVGRMIEEKLARFLHPITGSLDEQGWKLGAYPSNSSVHGCLMKVPGVHHIQRLHLRVSHESSALVESRYFFVCSGEHHIHSITESVPTA